MALAAVDLQRLTNAELFAEAQKAGIGTGPVTGVNKKLNLVKIHQFIAGNSKICGVENLKTLWK